MMKRHVFFISIILISVLLGKTQTNDSLSIIFPIKGEAIKECFIIQIGPGNTICYVNDLDTIAVLAKAYLKNGELFSLHESSSYVAVEHVNKSSFQFNPELSLEQNNDLLYHQNRYKKHKKNLFKAIPFLGAGTLTFMVGAAWYSYEKVNLSDDNIPNDYGPPNTLMTIGGVSLAVGCMIMITNTIIASKHKKEIEKIKNQKLSIQLGVQKNGVGIAINF